MAAPDLSRLKIDRSGAKFSTVRGRGWSRRLLVPLVVGVVVFAAVAFAVLRWSGAPLEVETASVTMAYPSQGYTMLNATGYVVAQRKAAVASKATGRLVWLGVEEGSRVKKDEVIARLEDLD
ncbi:MAG TPA: efflux RND transporter periplasmic adaptor subunit, partial [Burkholderiales bacterium]